ncbi:FAD/NAD(P)-binding protein [Acuticoccus kandeliae]|uniref:FAD/NAD(P)-binding protein n=1 Tax=Acuticoccus kandeliae TaxID=2073160 RepID=UPI000D3EB61C|nr:FAD/NAD(P)-binding protein [Acuticoccus kandeliae]
MTDGRVVIVGGGAAAAWLVMALLRRGVEGIDVVEPAAEIGRGLAYATSFPMHLLNVPADKMDMEVEPGDPRFGDWLARVAPRSVPHGYAPRGLYGDFLTAAFRDAIAGRDVRHRRTRVRAVEPGLSVVLEEGEPIAARAVVLALGNLPPRRLAPGITDPRIVEDPWAVPPAGRTGQDVLIAGTGLTAIDAVLAIDAADPAARFTLTAARAFLPPADAIVEAWPEGGALVGRSPVEAWRTVSRALRREADPATGWYRVIDGARPHVEPIWRAWTPAQKATFWRHGARHWLHHRHRAAPESMAAIDALMRAGRLSLARGRVSDVRADGDAIEAKVGGVARRVDLLVNATGPSLDLVSHPVLAGLAHAGLVAPDPNRLGIATSGASEVLDGAGRPVAGLYALGALTRGSFFEIVAVPHIRRKAALVADALKVALG